MELHRAECPNCGAALDLSPGLGKGVIACSTCGSVLNAASEGLDIVANVASGSYDPIYPIMMGQDWTWKDHTFRVSGRLRYRYDDGFWDEWFCIAEDGQTLWLEDDEGSLRALNPLTPTNAPTRDLLEDSTQTEYVVNGTSWRVKERGAAKIEWFEGQLPWRVKPGTEVRYLDLKGAEGRLSIEWTRRELEFYTAHSLGSVSTGAAAPASKGKTGLVALLGAPFAVIAVVMAGVFLSMCLCCAFAPSTPPSGKRSTYGSDTNKKSDTKRRTGYYGGGRGGSGGGYGYGK